MLEKLYNSPNTDVEDLNTLKSIYDKSVSYLGKDSKKFKKYDDMYFNTLRFLNQKYFSN